MTICPQVEKMVVAYDTNFIQVFDLNNTCMHQWSRTNGKYFPHNFMTRFNRIVGITALSEQKFLLYTNYTYIVFDLALDLPKMPNSEVKIIQDHPGKELDHGSTWNECLRKSQQQYLNSDLYPSTVLAENLRNKLSTKTVAKEENGHESHICENLTISNGIKGILNMSYSQKTSNLTVIETQWRKTLENFQGALVLNKYGK